MRDIIPTLVQLKAKPSNEWKTRTKTILLAKIAADETTETNRRVFSFIDTTRLFLPDGMFLHLSFRILLVLGLMLGGYITTVYSANNSIPGDSLYAVKRADEEIRRAVFTLVQEERVGELELEWARRRLNEAGQIADSKEGNDENKNEKVKAAVAEVRTHIEKARNEVANLSSRGKVQQAVALATKVETEGNSISQTLTEKQEDLAAESAPSDTVVQAAGSAELQEAMGTTAQSVDKAVLDVIDVVVEQYVSGNTHISTDEIKGKIANKIEEVMAKADEKNKKDEQNEEQAGESGGGEGGSGSSDETPSFIDTKAVKAEIATDLKQAKELLESGDIAASFRRVKHADELMGALSIRKGKNDAESPSVEGSVSSEKPRVDESVENVIGDGSDTILELEVKQSSEEKATQ